MADSPRYIPYIMWSTFARPRSGQTSLASDGGASVPAPEGRHNERLDNASFNHVSQNRIAPPGLRRAPYNPLLWRVGPSGAVGSSGVASLGAFFLRLRSATNRNILKRGDALQRVYAPTLHYRFPFAANGFPFQ